MNTGKKLAALNLALIFALTLLAGTPAAATTGEKEGGSISGASGAYLITVGSVSFYSDQDNYGTGWSYDAEDTILWLNNYVGSGIAASGDLTVRTRGIMRSTITGKKAAAGLPAIDVTGCLVLDTTDGGEIYLTGGEGTGGTGGDGLRADTAVITCNSGSTFTGGYGTAGGGSGISGGEISVSGKLNITGGGADTGAPGGPAISYERHLCIGPGDMEILAGSRAAVPFSTSGGVFECSTQATLTWIDTYLAVVAQKSSGIVNTVTLDGNGGTMAGESVKILAVTYPEWLSLHDYEFTREGYEFVGWQTPNGRIITGENGFTTSSDTTLRAVWAAMGEDAVLFNGNGGTVDGEAFITVSAAEPVAVPDTGRTDAPAASGDLYLLGWCEAPSAAMCYFDYVLNPKQKWYLPGRTYAIPSGTVLYAVWLREDWHCNTVLYDGNGGVSSAYGQAVVQSSALSGKPLQLTVKDDMDFTREGYDFAGWYDAEGVRYSSGTKIDNTDNAQKVTALHARWSRTFTAQSGDGADTATCVMYADEDVMDVSFNMTSADLTGVMRLPFYCALYDSGGRMIAIAGAEAARSGSSLLGSATVSCGGSAQPDTCRFFVLKDASGTPAAEPIACGLS